MASEETVISTTGLAKSYGKVAALKPLDLKVPKNSIFGFLGPNGAGKTTTIKLLLGLARPTAGGGQVFGRDIQHESVEIRKRVGYLAQDPRYYEHMSARETLRFTAGFFFSRGPVIGITLLILFGFQIFTSLAPGLLKVMPWMLTLSSGTELSFAAMLALGQRLPSMLPIYATVGWCLLFVVVAVWRFNREEF